MRSYDKNKNLTYESKLVSRSSLLPTHRCTPYIMQLTQRKLFCISLRNFSTSIHNLLQNHRHDRQTNKSTRTKLHDAALIFNLYLIFRIPIFSLSANVNLLNKHSATYLYNWRQLTVITAYFFFCFKKATTK